MKKKICLRCKLPIDEKKDRYVHLEDFFVGEKINESWLHIECFKKSMNRDLKELELQAKTILDRTGNMFDRLGLTKKEIIIK